MSNKLLVEKNGIDYRIPRYGNALSLLFEYLAENAIIAKIASKPYDDNYFNVIIWGVDYKHINNDELVEYINLNL